MRDRENWIKILKKEMGGESPPIPMKFPDFARTELLLYALHNYFPDRSIQKAHLLMQGYREPNMTDEQWEILNHLCHLTPEFRSSISWEIALRSYEEVAKSSASWLGFEIDLKANTISLTNKMIVQRYQLYEKVLNQALLFKTRAYKPAPAGDYEFNLDPQQTRVIRIPPEIAKIGIENGGRIPSIKLSKDRAPIKVTLTDLIEKGSELKSVLGYDAGEIQLLGYSK
jgi:pPIWI RE three-gene island domain Z